MKNLDSSTRGIFLHLFQKSVRTKTPQIFQEFYFLQNNKIWSEYIAFEKGLHICVYGVLVAHLHSLINEND